MATIETATKKLAEKLSHPRPGLEEVAAKPISYPPTVTPYLPREAELTAQAHEHTGHPAFVKAYEKSSNEYLCWNCQGMGFVLLILTSAGPMKSPPPTGVITWFDGNERYGKGWYVIDSTLQFTCPECHGE